MKKLIFALTLLFSILAVQDASAANLTWVTTPNVSGSDIKVLDNTVDSILEASFTFKPQPGANTTVTHNWVFNASASSYVSFFVTVLANFTVKLDNQLIQYGDSFLLSGQHTLTVVMKKIGASVNGNAQEQLYLTSTVVPIPAAIWLFGSAFLGLIGAARRKTVTPAI
ncbi:VPLPA-CTERM sorting domain-containing protein [Methylocucumis oryzae]|uniref:PEP-CTERM protein-sorting domain-containing protein n=1 Tax=Methylocucumis oryzae TaxID=1632867 RepID=A0A0F3IKY9_9GAMM|nr:VPLPA-CTERM sorting domain-containing protein [Methylocucumis oryzae]KJV07342.1 hypothetical protein VZ94_05485 [Methylocucumis oryzae]